MKNKRTHLEFIQRVIERMVRNSFMTKGWTVILVSALFALASGNSRVEFALLAFLPAIMFWFLDGFFLQQEWLFRALYDDVHGLDESRSTSPWRQLSIRPMSGLWGK